MRSGGSGLLRAGPADRLRAFGAPADAGTSRLGVDRRLVEHLARVSDLLDTDSAAVLLLDERSGRLSARAAHGVEREVRAGVSLPVGIGFAGRIAAERRPVLLDRVDATTVANPILWEEGIRSMLGVPPQSGRRLLGVLHAGGGLGDASASATSRSSSWSVNGWALPSSGATSRPSAPPSRRASSPLPSRPAKASSSPRAR